MKRVKPPSPPVDETKVYHVSNQRNRESISQHGLIPGEEGNNWVFKKPSTATTMSAGVWGGPGKNDVWEIDHPHSELHPDTHPGWETNAHAQEDRAVIKGRVDPSRMRLFNDRRQG